MTLSPHKIAEIRKLKKQRKSYREIRAEIGVCFDSISKYGENPQASPSTSTVSPQADKNPVMLKDQTKQIIDKVSTTNDDKQHPTTNTTPDPNYQRLEQMIKDSDHARQTQQQTTDLLFQNVTKIVN
jgi:hypothetical protein